MIGGINNASMNTKNTLFPGLLLCGAVTLAAHVLEYAEIRWLGRAWLESLVLAILLGTALRTLCRLDPRFDAGIHFQG